MAKFKPRKKMAVSTGLTSLESHHWTSSPATHVRYRSTYTPPTEEFEVLVNIWRHECVEIRPWKSKMKAKESELRLLRYCSLKRVCGA